MPKKILKNVIQALSCKPKYAYYLNDPSTPDLTAKSILPDVNNLQLNVIGLNKNKSSLKLGSSQSRAGGAYINCAQGVNYVQSILNVKLTKWANGKLLNVNPEAGKGFNAYYDRANIKFFYGEHPLTKEIIYSSDSTDIVLHELGHAILDAIKPELWHSQSIETWAFHEAFADIFAVASIMQNKLVLKRMLEETNGDLMRTNIVSRIAEEFGNALYYVSQNISEVHSLRDVSEIWPYQDPKTLHSLKSNEILTSESHSFSRVFSGAWYGILAAMFKSDPNNSEEGLKYAVNKTFDLLIKAIIDAPKVTNYFEAVARLMVKHAHFNREIVQSIFIARNIITPDIKMLSNEDYKFYGKEIVRINRMRSLKLSDCLITGQASTYNPLYDAEIEVPDDFYYEKSSDGERLNEIKSDYNEMIINAAYCLDVLHREDKVGTDKMWSIKNNKLIRNRIN